MKWDGLPVEPGTCGRLRHQLSAMLATVLLVAGCGGGGSGSEPATAADEGTVYIGLTDADGDFLRYEVDVVSIKLRRADGTEVDTLPNATRLDFARYVDLTEFFTAAQVPAGRYVRGEITLDYANADVWVEIGGNATQAVTQDPDGQPLGLYTLQFNLDDGHPLVVRRGLPALLTVDFDLDASHQVDLGQSPPMVTAAPFLSADIDLVAGKELRVRGPLVSVDEAGSSYTIDVRPFQRHDGRFGELVVHTTETTSFEVDGTAYSGAAGLAAMTSLAAASATVAFGTLDVAEHRFTAEVVHAGDSVPGARFDVVAGNVTARQGNTLRVRGALLTPRTGAARFHDDVTVLIGAETAVHRFGDPTAVLDIGAVSVGQRVEIFGELADAAAAGDSIAPTLDADPGRVRLLVTHLSGIAAAVINGQLRLDLASIDGRRIGIFDFAGTGLTPDLDADPADYEVATGALDLSNIEPGEATRIFGFVRSFGQAPDDFEAIAVMDRAAPGGALLGIGWRREGTTAPFASLGSGALVLDLANPDIGARHHLAVAGIVTDLLDLPASPSIEPAADGPARFAIAAGRQVQVFAEFPAFAAKLGELLDGSRRAFALHAEGRYDRDANVLYARIIGVNLSRNPPP